MWCNAHHLRHWAHGGVTALRNLVLLCAHHHRVVHHDGWHVHIGADGHPCFIPPRWVHPTQLPITKPWRAALRELNDHITGGTEARQPTPPEPDAVARPSPVEEPGRPARQECGVDRDDDDPDQAA